MEEAHWLHRWLDTPRARRMPRIAIWSGELRVAKGKGAELARDPALASVSGGEVFLEARVDGDVAVVVGLDWTDDYERRFQRVEAAVRAAAALGGKGSIVCLSDLGRTIRDAKAATWSAGRWVKWTAKAGAVEIDEGEKSNEKKVLAALDAVASPFDAWLAASPGARERMEHREHYGYLDRDGRVVVAPTLSAASEMSDGLASVVAGGDRRVIDREGRVVLEGIVNAGAFLRGRMPVSVQGPGNQQPWGYADGTGAIVVPCQLYEASPFHGPLAIVRVGNAMGSTQRWIDASGALVGEAFDFTHGFSENRAWVWAGGVFRCIGETGAPVFEGTFANAAPFADGLAAAIPAGGTTWGYLDTSGHFVVPPRFELAYPFAEDGAAVKLGGAHRLVDRSGEPRGESFEAPMAPMSEGRIAVKQGGLVGFLDSAGAWAIRPTYDEAYAFHEGLAYASTKVDGEARWGFVDASGAWVIPPTLEWANRFEGGLAPAKIDGRFGFVDRAGRWAIAPAWKRVQPRFTSGLVWAQLP